MKKKFSLVSGVLILGCLTLDLSSTLLAQGYNKAPTGSGSAPAQGVQGAAVDPNALKPGTTKPDGTVVAIQVTPEEAAKKYPAQNGKSYPPGDPNYAFSHKPGYIRSPYSSTVYDCSKVGKGGLVLDEHVKKVFVKP